MNETKQTAVEQLFIEMLEIQQSGKTLTFDENVELLNKYKEMEKEQIFKIRDEYELYLEYEFNNQCGGQSIILNFEEWYNETYGGNNEQQ